MSKMNWLGAVLVAALVGCSSTSNTTDAGTTSDAGTSSSGNATITIKNFAFSPTALTVAAGDTVTVVNMDGIGHSVTSEAKTNDFTSGAASGIQFDTGVFSTGTKSFIIPSTAASGTVVPFFCSVHKSTMGQGTITVK